MSAVGTEIVALGGAVNDAIHARNNFLARVADVGGHNIQTLAVGAIFQARSRGTILNPVAIRLQDNQVDLQEEVGRARAILAAAAGTNATEREVAVLGDLIGYSTQVLTANQVLIDAWLRSPEYRYSGERATILQMLDAAALATGRQVAQGAAILQEQVTGKQPPEEEQNEMSLEMMVLLGLAAAGGLIFWWQKSK